SRGRQTGNLNSPICSHPFLVTVLIFEEFNRLIDCSSRPNNSVNFHKKWQASFLSSATITFPPIALRILLHLQWLSKMAGTKMHMIASDICNPDISLES